MDIETASTSRPVTLTDEEIVERVLAGELFARCDRMVAVVMAKLASSRGRDE